MKTIFKLTLVMLAALAVVFCTGCPSGSDPLSDSNDKGEAQDNADSYLFVKSSDSTVDPVSIILSAAMNSITAVPSNYNNIMVDKIVLVYGGNESTYLPADLVEIDGETEFLLTQPDVLYGPGPATYTFYGEDLAGHSVMPLALNLVVHFAPAPTVILIAPAAPYPVVGGCTVTITGTDFVDGAIVTFGTQDAASVTVVNSTTLTAVTPVYTLAAPGTPETVDVIVTNPNGKSGKLVGGITFTDAFILCP